MIDIASTIKEIKVVQDQQVNDAPVYEQKIDSAGRAYATGKKKNAIAKIWLKAGTGKVTINNKEASEYLKRSVLRMIIGQPFDVTSTLDRFDIDCTAIGGGLSGQAYAIRHGIAKALTLYDPTLRPLLKKAGFLTRDSRIVERKKSGQAKARKNFQFSKR